MESLPALLAGPILRRTEPGRVCIWLATSRPVEAAASVHRLHPDRTAQSPPVGTGTGESVSLGERLFVHLVTVAPTGDREFPVDELLGYQVELEGVGRLEQLLPGLAFEGFSLPTFFIRRSVPTLHLLHGSCRMLQGKGEDAFVAADGILARHAADVQSRPAALFLTGDQIYGDQVAGPLARHITQLGSRLVGPHDDESVPGVHSLSKLPIYGREEVALEKTKFTSSHAANHLLSFGEFAATYVTAWNEAVWPVELAPADSVQDIPDEERKTYTAEIEDLERARAALPAVRRVLANTPTYMIFDDHDVTDDWNITREWCERVTASPTGRRVVANALAAFWAFQGWGNLPEAFDPSFKDTVSGHVSGRRVDPDAYDSRLWTFASWSFFVPTDPPAVVLDTRTQRSFESPQGAARLIGKGERKRVADLVGGSGYVPGRPLILVSPVPTFGLELQERRQKFLVGKVGPYEIDFEAWHSNLQGFVDFMRLLIDELGVRTCVVLSGDVHYGLTAHASFSIGERVLSFEQLVSSSFKHGGALSRAGLNLLGTLVTKRHERWGWDRPPPLEDETGLKHRVVARAANTDEWSEDSPVFLSPRRARQLNITQAPDYRETRDYVAPSERRSSVLVGETNVGLMSLRGDELVHRLYGCRSADDIRVFTTELRLRPTS